MWVGGGQQAGSWQTSHFCFLASLFMEPLLVSQLQLGLIGWINAEHEQFSILPIHHRPSSGLTSPLLPPWGRGGGGENEERLSAAVS